MLTAVPPRTDDAGLRSEIGHDFIVQDQRDFASRATIGIVAGPTAAPIMTPSVNRTVLFTGSTCLDATRWEIHFSRDSHRDDALVRNVAQFRFNLPHPG
jgi:hypothetical protein